MACLVDSCLFDDGWATGNRGDWSSGAGHTATETVLWNTRGMGNALIRSFTYGQGYVVGTEAIGLYVETDTGLSTLHLGTAPVDYTEFVNGARYLRPQSLYESQRSRRLGLPEPVEGEPPPSELTAEYTGDNPVSVEADERVEIGVSPLNVVDVPRYQWCRVETGETLSALAGANSNTLVFETVTQAHAGTYVCIVTDTIGEVRSPEITLHVRAKMPFTGLCFSGAFVLLAGLGVIALQKSRIRPDCK